MKLRRDYLINIIGFYGFSECGEIFSFLTHVCDEYPDNTDIVWIYGKVNQCLRANNNGGEYFYALERLKSDIEIEFMSPP